MGFTPDGVTTQRQQASPWPETYGQAAGLQALGPEAYVRYLINLGVVIPQEFGRRY
jgi:hypothetical protein